MVKKLGHIAYNKLDGKSPTVVFFSGFKSDMEGTKAVFLESVCKEIGQSSVRFDYSGHGKSGGDFKDGTISLWLADSLKIIDELTEGPLILVGSSMGGWIMLLAALLRPERVKALIGIASAPDFTEELIWKKFSKAQQDEFLKHGFIEIPNCYDDEPSYPITKGLIEDGRKNLLLLNSAYDGRLAIACPVTLLHGMKDEDVPYSFSIRLAEKLVSDDVKLHLIKNANHRMSEPDNLALLKVALFDRIK